MGTRLAHEANLRDFDTAAEISMSQVGGDTVIDFSYADGSTTLVGVSLNQLVNSDWLA